MGPSRTHADPARHRRLRTDRGEVTPTATANCEQTWSESRLGPTCTAAATSAVAAMRGRPGRPTVVRIRRAARRDDTRLAATHAARARPYCPTSEMRESATHHCMSRETSRFRNVGGPLQSSANRAATSPVSGSSEFAVASSRTTEFNNLDIRVRPVPIASLHTPGLPCAYPGSAPVTHPTTRRARRLDWS